jgi:Capsule polysaccharide biosynthesis protein
MSKPTVLFFARGYQAFFYPHLISDAYDAIFVTLTNAEKKEVLKMSGTVVGCFEDDYASIIPSDIDENYLITSFVGDRFLGRFSHDKRLEILGKEVAFWASILEKYKPLAVINELVAIEISEVLLIEARKHNILYLAGVTCPAEGHFYWLNNPISLSGKFLTEKIPSTASIEEAKKHVDSVFKKKYLPFYVKNLKSRTNVQALISSTAKLLKWHFIKLKATLTGSFKYELYIDEYSKRINVYIINLFHFYNKITDLPNDKEIILYPLHQEPEATLNYMSIFYSNQVAMIENILKCMTINQVLVIKEHPVDKGSLLQKKFRNLKKHYSGLYYIAAEVPSGDVIKVSSRIVTLTSTVAWEGLVLGKKVYVLGEIFYDHLVGITKINNFNDLQKVLHTKDLEKKTNPKDIVSLISNMVEQSYKGNPFQHPELYSDTNKARVVYAIKDAINKHYT